MSIATATDPNLSQKTIRQKISRQNSGIKSVDIPKDTLRRGGTFFPPLLPSFLLSCHPSFLPFFLPAFPLPSLPSFFLPSSFSKEHYGSTLRQCHSKNIIVGLWIMNKIAGNCVLIFSRPDPQVKTIPVYNGLQYCLYKELQNIFGFRISIIFSCYFFSIYLLWYHHYNNNLVLLIIKLQGSWLLAELMYASIRANKIIIANICCTYTLC